MINFLAISWSFSPVLSTSTSAIALRASYRIRVTVSLLVLSFFIYILKRWTSFLARLRIRLARYGLWFLNTQSATSNIYSNIHANR